MGAQLTYGALATGGGFCAQPGTIDSTIAETLHVPAWSWTTRGKRNQANPGQWRGKWSYGCSIGFGAPSGSDGASGAGYDMCIPNWWAPPVYPDGNQTLKFIKGACVDVSDAALSGCNVQAYRTSDGAVAGIAVQSRTDGSYDVPSAFPGVNHFVTATLAGSPDRAAITVNTLVPTGIDGT